MSKNCSCRRCIKNMFHEFDVWLRVEHKLKRVPTLADGNCLFHALSMYSKELKSTMTHLSLRRSIVSYIHDHRSLFGTDIEFGTDFGTVDNYVEQMGKPGVWGDAIALHAFSLLYNVNVVVLTPPRGYCELLPDEESTKRDRIGLVRIGDHYEATTGLE